MAEGIYDHINKPTEYRSIPDLVEAPRADLSFREKHRLRCVFIPVKSIYSCFLGEMRIFVAK